MGNDNTIHGPSQTSSYLRGVLILALLAFGLGVLAMLLPTMSRTARVGFSLGACTLGGAAMTWGVIRAHQRRQLEATHDQVIEAMAERVHDGIVIVRDECVAYANSAMFAILGYRAEDLTGQSIAGLVAPGNRDAVLERYRRRMRGLPEPTHYETVLAHRDGTLIPVDLRVGEVTYQNVPATLAIIRDLTERKRTEAALHASETRSAAIIAALPDLVFRLSRAGEYLDIHVHGEHKEPLRSLDTPTGSTIGKRFHEVLPAPQADLILAAVRTALDTDEMQIVEYVLPTVSGPRTFEARIVVSGPDEVVSIVRDVTERKRVEQERERLIKDLDAFSATVAHDLKTPLTSIMGYTEMLTDDFDSLSAEDRRQFLWIVAHESQKMDRIIHELLLFASVREQRDVPRRPLNMDYIVTNALGRMSYLITERKAQVNTPDGWPLARGYAPWIEEVWVNYLSNALKYGGSPPLITLGADAQPGGMVRFWIADNGPGVAPENQDRIFEQFTRLNDVQVSGYGLGLSIVKRIVEKLGGTAGVQSDGASGSTFYFDLPGM